MKTELRAVGAFVVFSVVGIGLAGSPASAGGPIIVEDMPGDASDEFEYFDEERPDGARECVPWEVVFGAECLDDYLTGAPPGDDPAPPAPPADPADPTDGGSDNDGGDTGGGGGGGAGYVGDEGGYVYYPDPGFVDPGAEDPTDTGPTVPPDTGGIGGGDTGPPDTGGDTGDTGSNESSASGEGRTSPKPGPSKGKIHLEGPQR